MENAEVNLGIEVVDFFANVKKKKLEDLKKRNEKLADNKLANDEQKEISVGIWDLVHYCYLNDNSIIYSFIKSLGLNYEEIIKKVSESKIPDICRDKNGISNEYVRKVFEKVQKEYASNIVKSDEDTEIEKILKNTNEYIKNKYSKYGITSIDEDLINYTRLSDIITAALGRETINFNDLEMACIFFENKNVSNFCNKAEISFWDLSKYAVNVFNEKASINSMQYKAYDNCQVEEKSEKTTEKVVENSEESISVAEKISQGEEIIKSNVNKIIKKIGKEDISCNVINKDNIVNKLFYSIRKKEENYVLIVGENGAGKTAVIESMVYRIVNGDVPSFLANAKVFSLDLNEVSNELSYLKEYGNIYAAIANYFKEYDNPVLVIENIEAVDAEDGTSFNITFRKLIQILKKANVKVIGTMNNENYEVLSYYDDSFMRKFNAIFITEPEINDVYKMIKTKISELEKFHNVKISKEVAEYGIYASKCFKYYDSFPDKAVNAIDCVLSKCEIENKKRASKRDFGRALSNDYAEYKRIPEIERRRTAYHEMGHFLVARYSEFSKEFNIDAVSIMPAQDFAGVTIYSYKNNGMLVQTIEVMKANVATSIGGRVAEQEFETGILTAGASSDLAQANYLVYLVLCKLGFVKGNNNHQLLTYDKIDLNSNDALNQSYRENANKIFEECEKLAKNIIKKNRKLMDILVDRILKEDILDRKELNEIVTAYEKEHQDEENKY